MDERERELTVARLLAPHWRALLIGLLAVGAETIAALLEPWPIKIVFDNVLRAQQTPAWWQHALAPWFGDERTAVLTVAAVGVIAIAFVGAIGTYVEKQTVTALGLRVTHELRRVFYWHVQRLSMSYHDRRRTGDVISTVTTDIDAIQSALSTGVLDTLYYLLIIGGMIAVMSWLDWRFTLIALAIVPLLFLTVFTFTRRIKQSSRAMRKKEAEMVSTVQDVLSAIRLVKAFGREEYEQQRFEAASRETVELALRARKIKAKLSPAVEMIVAIGTAIVLWVGARQALAGALTPGVLIVFVLYLGKMYKPMRELSKMTDTYSRAIVGYERINDFLALELQVRDFPGARPAPPFKGAIEFDRVTFGYSSGSPVLNELSLRIAPGQTAALVGATGSGKTTLISLIPRFYDPQSGAVRIDGVDVRRYQRLTVRQQMSFVLQESFLFPASVCENIAYGRLDASRDEIVRAARVAHADEFIERLPQGYDTIIGERGNTLSRGQQQRIAIARAVLRDTPILILDEPVVGLDAASEQLVLDALRRLMLGKTAIVIAHRLATVERADVIFVLGDGRVREQGTHTELLAAGGLYAHYYALESSRLGHLEFGTKGVERLELGVGS